MRALILLCVALTMIAACASKPVGPGEGAETVQVATTAPGESFTEIGPVTGVDGQGCGEEGRRGTREGAVSSLMKNASAIGGTYVHVFSLHEPRQMGNCFVNSYRITGTAYR